MAGEGLGIVYSGQDNSGGAAVFDNSPQVDYGGLLRQRQLLQQGKKQKQTHYPDDVSAAQLGKAWYIDKPVLEEKYKDYEKSKIEAEFAPDDKKTELYHQMIQKKADLVFAINKSADDQQHFLTNYNKVHGDSKMLYGDEDFKMLDDYVQTPLDQRKMLDINPASTISADATIFKNIGKLKPETESVKVTNPDGSYSWRKDSYVSEDRIREWAKSEIEALPENQKRALKLDAMNTYPQFALMTPQEQENLLVEGRMAKAQNMLGEGVHIRSNKAAQLSKEQKDMTSEETGSGVQNKNYVADVIIRDGVPVITINPRPGAKETLKEITYNGWNGEAIPGTYIETLPPEKTKSGQWEIALSQPQTERIEVEKKMLEFKYYDLKQKNKEDDVDTGESGLTKEQEAQYQKDLKELSTSTKQAIRVTVPADDVNWTKVSRTYFGGGLGSSPEEFVKKHSSGASRSSTIATNRGGAGKTIKVRRKSDGAIGNMPVDKFDPKKYDKL